MTTAQQEDQLTNYTSDNQRVNRSKAQADLMDIQHDLTNRQGILKWLAAVGTALTHDLPEMPRQKANTSANVAGVALKAIAP